MSATWVSIRPLRTTIKPDPRKVALQLQHLWVQAHKEPRPSYNVLRPTPNFGRINYFSRDGHSNYHALQVQLRSKLSNFSNIKRSLYLVAHDSRFSNRTQPTAEAARAASRTFRTLARTVAMPTINRPHIFVFNEVFFLPKFRAQGKFRPRIGWRVGTQHYLHGPKAATPLPCTKAVWLRLVRHLLR